MCGLLDPLGPYVVMPMKTFIAFANGVNFAFLKTKKRGIELSLVLGEHPDPDRFKLVIVYSGTKSIYKTQIQEITGLDDEVEDLLIRAFRLTL